MKQLRFWLVADDTWLPLQANVDFAIVVSIAISKQQARASALASQLPSPLENPRERQTGDRALTVRPISYLEAIGTRVRTEDDRVLLLAIDESIE